MRRHRDGEEEEEEALAARRLDLRAVPDLHRQDVPEEDQEEEEDCPPEA